MAITHKTTRTDSPNIVVIAAVAAAGLLACGSDQPETTAQTPVSPGPGAESANKVAQPSMPGLHMAGDRLVLETDPFTVPPASEIYMCWTTTVSDAIKVQSYETGGHSVIHHFVLATTTDGGSDGIAKCDAAFQVSWRPLFAAGAGQATLSLPQGVVQPIAAHTRLIVQLHLLNSTDAPITDRADLTMKLNNDANTQSALFAVIGNPGVSLPPHQTSQVQANCQARGGARVVGFFPHMHMLGTAMTLEVGASADDMTMLYARDPYDFNSQKIDSVDFTIDQGAYTRLTCSYNNTRDETVEYGESSFNEMCYLIMFVVGSPGVGCVMGSPSANAGATGAMGQKVEPDPSCPSVDAMGTGAKLAGCCTEGMCGIDASSFGAGCVELGQAAAGAMQMAGSGISFPAPRACGGQQH